tara:strand:+ start:8097 stop:8636 length:540 start_codon:yes stop_codon:yes gene_type:complete
MTKLAKDLYRLAWQIEFDQAWVGRSNESQSVRQFRPGDRADVVSSGSERTTFSSSDTGETWTAPSAELSYRKVASADIAKTILSQMGGWRRISMMTGAKSVISHKAEGEFLGGVSFKFSNNGRGKPNHVKVMLHGSDTYTVSFGRIRGYNFKEIKTLSGIYAGQLKSVFERQTGLYLSL